MTELQTSNSRYMYTVLQFNMKSYILIRSQDETNNLPFAIFMFKVHWAGQSKQLEYRAFFYLLEYRRVGS
jgi:hypothetical protein